VLPITLASARANLIIGAVVRPVTVERGRGDQPVLLLPLHLRGGLTCEPVDRSGLRAHGFDALLRGRELGLQLADQECPLIRVPLGPVALRRPLRTDLVTPAREIEFGPEQIGLRPVRERVLPTLPRQREVPAEFGFHVIVAGP